MRTSKAIAGAAAAALNLCLSPAQAVEAAPAQIEAAFSPDGGAAALVIRTIDSAQTSIRVAAFTFTSKRIAQALRNAHRRGVDVRVVLDASQNRASYSGARFIAKPGIPTRLNSRYPIMHNKFMVLDGRDVETGSLNFTNLAERNAENVLVVRANPALAAAYTREWERLWAQSEEYWPGQ